MQRWRHKTSYAAGFSRAQLAGALRHSGFEILEERGFQWSLARTGSNSRLVTVSAVLEKALGLNRWLAQSPWLLYACRKTQ